MSEPYRVVGPFAYDGPRLTFSVGDPGVALRCWHARDSGSEMTVTLTQSDGPKNISGKVQSVDVLPGAERPLGWQVVMQCREP